jgi:two-component system response regulator AtoC
LLFFCPKGRALESPIEGRSVKTLCAEPLPQERETRLRQPGPRGHFFGADAQAIIMGAGRVYILDDEANMVRILGKILTTRGFEIAQFTDPAEAVRAIERDPPDVLVTDVSMPEMNGMEVLARARAVAPATRVVIITAYGTIDGAIQALKDGAVEYITKPFETPDLLAKIERAAAAAIASAGPRRDASPESGAPESDNDADASSGSRGWEGLERQLLGDSSAMREARRLIEKVAPTDSPVLIRGESGTGKELAARAIHELSPRASGKFAPVNCAAIPESLVESELFGYEKGAFTGAAQRKIGMIESASGGTLFLDEISELPLPAQAKLLRFLQEREIQRVGGVELIPVDIRLVAACNRDLEEMIEMGEFRADLFYRLNVIRVSMPPLRDRPEDIEPLTESFLIQRAAKRGGRRLRLSSDAAAKLRAYSWPGNVRELQNVVERMAILADGPVLDGDLLPEEIARGEREALPSNARRAAGEPVPTRFREAKTQFERSYMEDLLRKAGGSVTAASQISGISRRNLYDKIEKLEIDLEDFKRQRGRR